jgi:hypothetical protein
VIQLILKWVELRRDVAVKMCVGRLLSSRKIFFSILQYEKIPYI